MVDKQYMVSKKELLKWFLHWGTGASSMSFEDVVQTFFDDKTPIEPLNRSEVWNIVEELIADEYGAVNQDKVIKYTDRIMVLIPDVPKMGKAQFNKAEIRDKIKIFLKDNTREALFDVLPFEDLVKQLSTLTPKDKIQE